MEIEQDAQELLFSLAIKIQSEDYSEKPKYTGLTTQEILDPQIQFILSKISKITKYSLVSPVEICYKQKFEKSKERDKCPICLCEFYEEMLNEFEKNPSNVEFLLDIPFDVILLENCADHFFHVECLNNLIGDKNNFKCPICSKIYGVLVGDMPTGTFRAYKINDRCNGYNCNTIVINYNFPNGPGYTGTNRISYLPNNKEGREVLALLKIAFDRKLTFTVGTSVTTGRKNTVVWNGIHHKTSLFGGPTRFGYPDKNYFNRVKEELAAKGVTQESVGRNLESIAKEILLD
jgi:deltex-like protein